MNKKKIIAILTLITVICGSIITYVSSQPEDKIVVASDSTTVVVADSIKAIDSAKVIVPADSTKK